MRVVVVGGTGNVGSCLVADLLRSGVAREVVAIGRREPDRLPEGAEFRALDVATDALTPHFAGTDAVVHLGWLFQPSHRPEITWKANAVGSGRVFEAVAEARVPTLVYSSSVGAYSPRASDDPRRDERVDESWPTHSLPTAAYGREKAYVERLLDTFEARHPETRVVRLRPGFIFRRAAASQQRRLFAGPFVPTGLVRPGRLPVVPYPSGLRFQALHTEDAARAFRLAVSGSARGAFNVAAEPVIAGRELGGILGARAVAVPRGAAHLALAGAWHAHLAPAPPALFELALDLPLMDVSRARDELGWSPQRDATEALSEALTGMADGAGGPTPPLAPDSVESRVDEVATGVGVR